MIRLTPYLALLATSTLALAAPPVDKSSQVVVVYDLEGPISESGQAERGFADLSFSAASPVTLLDLTRSLQKAATDPAVKAVVIDADQVSADFAQLQEIRQQMLTIRAAGKDVWLYSEHLSNRTALLGSAANHFTLMPEADCDFTGIHSESIYFKGMLDRLGIEANVIHIGDFKSFGENFYRTGPSDYALKQEEKLIDSIYQQIVTLVANGRKLKPEQVQAIIDDGAITPKRALAATLVDHLMYRTDFVKKLRETYGKEADFDRNYELPDRDGSDIKGIMDVLKLVFKDSNEGKYSKDFVAVVALEGDITEESVAPVRTQLLKLSREEKAKAVVLRVNSPGGSALASELLWEATDEWKATGKPFVVSMGGVAASGGYYVSSSADRIFAEAGTITGSIGVVGMKFVVGQALEKIGITSHTTQRGKNAGAMSMMRGFSDEEAKVVRDSMTEVYTTFKKRVTDGRGKALKGDLESLAGGRVYSGKDALDVGLVDELGGLNAAILYATAAAKLDKPEIELLPAPKSGLEGLFDKPGKDDEDDEIIRASVTPTSLVKIRSLLDSSGVLDNLPAPARTAVSQLAARLKAFEKTQVLMLAPDFNLK